MHFLDMPTSISVTFIEEDGKTQVGRIRRYKDESKLFDILKAVHASLEAKQAVEMALASRCPGRVILSLTADQYYRLKFGQ